MFSGLIIKESLSDERLLDYVRIDRVEIWQSRKPVRNSAWRRTGSIGKTEYPPRTTRRIANG